jgi:DNA repair protein RadD
MRQKTEMEYILREYQVGAVEAGLRHFEKYNNPFVIIAPTGSGKSLIVANICHQLNEPTLILQPSKEILEQNYEKLLSYGVKDISIYSASLKQKEIAKFTYATIGSIYRKPELFKHFKKVIIDEAHLVNPKNLGGMYNTFFKAIECNSICGLTATPYRLVQRYYRKDEELYYTTSLATINRIFPFFFKKFAYKVSIQMLLEQGFLCPLEYSFYKDFDVSRVKINTTGADYDEAALENFWNDSRIEKLSNIIGEVDSKCKYNLIFCSSIRQAQRVTEMIRAKGMNAGYITSEHHSRERDLLVSGFRHGKIKHLVNVGIMGIGFDFPELDCITLARPTISLALLYQQIGRGMRVFPGKEKCKVIDITENVKKLGRIETIRIEKEEGGFKDIVVTEKGEITGKPLFTFKMKDEEKKNKILSNSQLTNQPDQLSF